MEEIAAHVDRFYFVTLSCPSCGIAKSLSVEKFKDKKHRFTARCECDYRFVVKLNFRKHFRKNVGLQGEVMMLSPKTSFWKKMNICDLSMNGISFKMLDGTVINKGDKLRVRFNLDNKQKSLIDKKVRVKGVDEGYFRCEFIELAAEEKDLGFYLFT